MTRRPFVPPFLWLLSAFAAGVLLDRGGWLPGRSDGQPPAVRRAYAPFWQAREKIHKYYADPAAASDERLLRGAISGMVFSLGDVGHSTYLTAEDRARLRAGLAGNLEGIGARLTLVRARPRLVITQTMPGSPARKAGVRAGDEILAVADRAAERMTLAEVVAALRGKPGTTVKVRLRRPGRDDPVTVTIKRAKVEVSEVNWQALPGEPALAHLAFHRFSNNSGKQMRQALRVIARRKFRGLVLDLRGNSGGYKDQAIKVASEFLREGEVIFIQQDAEGAQEPVKAKGGGVARAMPLVVLIDGGTASSAEILAGALQDHRRARLVGTRTFGTGTVLREYPLSDGSSVLLAIYQWLTPSGKRVWHRGVSPDVEVSLPYEATALVPQGGEAVDAAEYEASGDVQLKKARDLLAEQLKKRKK